MEGMQELKEGRSLPGLSEFSFTRPFLLPVIPPSFGAASSGRAA
jgi:hypothetical protein